MAGPGSAGLQAGVPALDFFYPTASAGDTRAQDKTNYAALA